MRPPPHQLERIEEERDGDGQARWRWVCRCRRLRGYSLHRGQWTWQSDSAAQTTWERHAKRIQA